MNPLVLEIPTIAIAGSSGKTTTREFIASILKTKWKILKNIGNNNLPLHIKRIVGRYNPSVQAILLELGMGKQGAGEKHCSYIQPNISIITNIGTAHYGNLGNSIESTAKFKSVLIKLMKPDGILFINKDDENSKLLDTTTFEGEVISVGINNNADYQASNIEYLSDGMSFQVILDDINETFFIPTFGMHSIYNALFAIAISHRLKFTAHEIALGLKNYRVPIKRLNFIQLSNQSLLIDDTVNANPQSVKAAIDVLGERGKDKKKIVVLGSMLELGEHSLKGHTEVGQYLAENRIDRIYTYGKEAKWIRDGAIAAGYPAEKIHHFMNRDDLHQELKNCVEPDSIILVKGSSSIKMDRTVNFLKSRFMYSIELDNNSDENSIYLSSQTLKKMNIDADSITLHFGLLTKNLIINIDNNLEPGKIILPYKLTDEVSIPDLPYDYYLEGDQLFLGPVIGLLVYPRYIKNPKQQLWRFLNYDKIKGLIFLFRPKAVNMNNKTISGYYYNPETKSFISGTFPYPSVIFNRYPTTYERYKYFKQHIGRKFFNYPYFNTNKWLFWVQMSKKPEIKEYLPLTQKYKGVNSLLPIFNKYDTVYLKPTILAGGEGILHIKKSDEGYVLSDRYGNKSFVESTEGLAVKLKENLVNRKYIIQQEIPSVNDHGDKIDFRIYIQKDYTKRWKFSAIETKVAKTGSIVSNSKNRERIVPGKTALKEFYGFNENETKQKIKEITELCIKVLKILEKNWGPLGDAAVDLIIDRNHKIWLLEVQLNYCAEIKAKRTKDEQLVLPMILPTPFEYAKALAGF